MSMYETNDGRFPTDMHVWTPYPLPDGDAYWELDWPWLRGTVLGQTGPDEWHIVIDAPEVRECCDSYEWSPACFRAYGALRPVAKPTPEVH
ncbi:hypothetical protein OG555_25105 [Kribbella sp. NBC_01484]|uniref:hypothetical protein n=1 Tax=Kribbella sp. NBC_01484 TaxID=2903579 RepID=UPI002E33805E|nr:hypothetical protein [Kribbella sp. NBC_01484]